MRTLRTNGRRGRPLPRIHCSNRVRVISGGDDRKAMYSVVGSYIPFAATQAERQDRRDARPVLSERYRSKADYVSQVALAVRELAEQGLLLTEDGDRYVETAIQVDILPRSNGSGKQS